MTREGWEREAVCDHWDRGNEMHWKIFSWDTGTFQATFRNRVGVDSVETKAGVQFANRIQRTVQKGPEFCHLPSSQHSSQQRGGFGSPGSWASKDKVYLP